MPFGRSVARCHASGISSRRALRIAVFVSGTLAVLPISTAALGANEYGTATENTANYGSKVTRTEVGVSCVGTGAGFVFDDLWQGIQDDSGWIEVGTSYCDAGDPAAKWVYAYYTPSTGYAELVLQRNVSVGTSHDFKIENPSDDKWNVKIDGDTKVSLVGFGNGSTLNSADVGLEVLNRMSSTQFHTYESDLKAWFTRTADNPWAGMDACTDTDSKIYPAWVSANEWRHTLNVSASESGC